ncbi:hypothetical protein RclHR1_11670009 [Rhizophagus clarus]|uniref:Uncharacterized protein n=1 Tax=Rhizophagus clarus TaxID=94130 RepID=A0A2Z6Q697_9GLOM|nr:hypothetical protein RclHR1_11670009 [Rhizophagus clarus]
MIVKWQKKYKTLYVKLEISQLFRNYEKHWMVPLMGFPVRWFPASWSLQERKESERYQAAVLNLPEKVKLLDGKRKIIGYLSNWDDLYRLINTPNIWNGETVDWTHHTSPSHNPRKSTKSSTDKSQRKTKSTNAFSPNDSAKTRSIKKVATGTNNISLQNRRGAASQQQYSSSTKPGKDSLKADYDNKKSKSKSKRSSASKKIIMAKITRMNEVLESLLKRTIA